MGEVFVFQYRADLFTGILKVYVTACVDFLGKHALHDLPLLLDPTYVRKIMYVPGYIRTVDAVHHTQVDLGSCPSEVVDRAIQSKELKRLMGRLNPKDLVLKVVGKEEYLLEEKGISCYQVWCIVHST